MFPLLAAAGASKADLVKAGIKVAAGAVGLAGTAILIGRALNRKDPFASSLVGEDLVFPKKLDNYSISLAFDFMEYERRSIFKQPYLRPSGTIRLPISKGIRDEYRMEWEEKPQDAMVGATIEAMMEDKDKIKAAISELGAAVEAGDKKRSLEALGGVFESGKDVVGAGAAGAALTAANNLLSSVSQTLSGSNLSLGEVLQPFGLAQNPFLTVLFKQPKFKRFKFNWRLAARDPDESATINAIINTFKYHLLPSIAAGTGGTLLHYPSIVNIGFFNSDEYLFRFKPCVIESMDVNYAPAATPAFFKGSENVPTEIDLSINVLEIEYWTRDDFKKNDMIPGVG